MNRLTKLFSALVLFSLLGLRFVQPEQVAQAQPPTQAPATHRVFLPLVIGGGTTQPPPPSGLSSFELIDAALQRGEISAETALVYKVYVVFDDPALPAQFRGDPINPDADSLMSEVAFRYKNLSPQAQANLRPFTIPPYHSGSWWDQRRQQPKTTSNLKPATTRFCDDIGEVKVPLTDWHYEDSANGKVRVWWQGRYPADEAIAKAYAADVDSIWQILFNLMKREPPSDGGGLRPCRGGDDRFDISLVDFKHNGQVFPYDGSGGVVTPSYMLMNRTTAARGTFIHELMHAFQNAFAVTDQWEYIWWKEATASWAIEYVEKLDAAADTNHEHNYTHGFLSVPQLPLETYKFGDLHQYGAYLYPWFVQLRSSGKGDFVRMSWETSEYMSNSLANLDSNVLGGFKEQWPEFSVYNVNRAPVDHYWKADKMATEAKFKLDLPVQLNGSVQTYDLDGEVAHLAAHYYRFRFNASDLRSVRFENPYVGGAWPTAAVRAVFKIGGQWYVQDWTELPYRNFCRDQKEDRVEELVIVLSNSEFTNRSHQLKPDRPPRLMVTNVACGGWKVDAQVTTIIKGATWESTNVVTTNGAILKRYVPPGGPFHAEFHRVQAGTAQWTHTGYVGGCSGSGAGSYEVTNGWGTYSLIVETYNLSYLPPIISDSRRYMAFGTMPSFLPQPKVTYTCPGGFTSEHPATVLVWLQTDRYRTLMTRVMNADGQTLEGNDSWSEPGSQQTITYKINWKMTALPPE